MVVVEGVALVGTDRDADPVASGCVFIPEGPDEAAVLDAGGGVVICEVVVAAGGAAFPAVVCVCELPLRAKGHAGVGVRLSEIGPLSWADGHAGLRLVVGELCPRAVGNAGKGVVICEEVGQRGAAVLAAVGGVIRVFPEVSAVLHAGPIGDVGVVPGRAGPDAVSGDGVCVLIWVGGTGPDAHLRVVVPELVQCDIADCHAFLEVGVGPQAQRAFLDAGLRAGVCVVLVGCGVVGVAVDYVCCVVGSHADATDGMAVLFLRDGALCHAGVGEISSEVSVGTLRYAEIGQIILIADHSGQRAVGVCPAIGDTALRGVLGPEPGRADADAAMRDAVGESGLGGWAMGHASSGQIIREFAVRTGVHTASRGAVLGVGALGAPLGAAASDRVAVIVRGRRGGQAGANGHAEIGGVIAELSGDAGVGADVVVGVAVGLGVVGADRHAPLAEVIGEARGAALGAFVDGGIGGGVVDCPVPLRADLDAGVCGIVDVGLDGKGLLAVLPTESAVIVRVAGVVPAGSDAFPGHVFSVGVDFDGTEGSAEGGCGVAPVIDIADGDAGLVDLAAEGAVGAGGGADPEDHISVDVLYLRTFCHALSGGIIGKGSGLALRDAGIGGVLPPGALAAVLLASAGSGVAVLVVVVAAGIAAPWPADAAVGIGEGVGGEAVEDADAVVGIVIW